MTAVSSVLSALARWAALDELVAAVTGGARAVAVSGVWGSARALAVAAISRQTGRAVLFITSGPTALRRAAADIRFFLSTLDSGRSGAETGRADGPLGTGGDRVVELPSTPPTTWRALRHREPEAERALVCYRLLAGEPVVVVATPAGLSAPMPTPEDLVARSFTLAFADTVPREALVERLEAAGYERVESVVEVGQWSLRGGIVDIFSPALPGPVRIEFFGDDVESLRPFDPTTQRSSGALESLEVVAMPSGPGPGLTGFLPADTVVVLDDPALLEAPPDDAPSALPLDELLGSYQRVELSLTAGAGAASARVDLGTRSVGGFRGQFKSLAEEIRRWRAEGFVVRLMVGDAGQGARLRQILAEHDLEAWPEATFWSGDGLGVVIGDCAGGFQVPALGLIALGEEEIFGAPRRRLRRPLFQRGAAVAAFTDLAPGDLVVHEDHGVGRYHGLRTLAVEGRDADFLLLEYGEGGRLYLPVDRLDLISKYMGAPETAARLDRLGGAAWSRVKESVRAALRQMAEQLLRLYASRAVAERPAFPADTPWQGEFEAAFRFEETPDQLRAIEEVKVDMERDRPMDRLVAGDVGYGKTEVALRAAFKAVGDGRQVAVLVPTTVLAQQHFNTFSERFGPFPARVELLSRFRSPREQKAVIEGLRTGTVDVVIGTHRLLSRDVQFRQLGLLVVDEEHRFGVTHKERIKGMRASVDVLTLTATPIPRTLHMAMSGVRDLSVIQTAPLDRLPVETVVAPWSRALIKDVIERELARGGQVFFVHNRVQSLASMTAFISTLVPDARVVMGHGQMSERELEAVMVKFVDGQADVLVSTAIVESGLDIPASNTIIVNRADRFGLAQLYQLRGRVGRERLQAYAYLLVPAGGRIDETAQRRLRVIEELTELGGGFKLALRDLEIRGAGNLLGAEQHGHIAAVGFDLYTKLLAEAVRELRGEPAASGADPTVAVEAEALLPESYVADVHQRLALYKRLADIGRPDDIDDMRGELVDRFGPLPAPAEVLLDVVGLRVRARQLGIERIEVRGGGGALITFAPTTPVAPEALLGLMAKSKGSLTMRREYTLEASLPAGPWPAARAALIGLLAALS